jgi:hypothetical protein
MLQLFSRSFRIRCVPFFHNAWAASLPHHPPARLFFISSPSTNCMDEVPTKCRYPTRTCQRTERSRHHCICFSNHSITFNNRRRYVDCFSPRQQLTAHAWAWAARPKVKANAGVMNLARVCDSGVQFISSGTACWKGIWCEPNLPGQERTLFAAVTSVISPSIVT